MVARTCCPYSLLFPLIFLIHPLTFLTMYTHPNLGHARFGKRDGFEMMARTGVLRDFRTAEAQDYLFHALQLRQEEIRPFPGAEVLGLTSLYWQGHSYRCLTLYRYALDRYKRDGYRAVSLALRDAWSDPALLLDELRHLCELDQHHPDPERAFRPGWRSYELPRPATPGRSEEGFVPLSEGSSAEQAALLEAWVDGLDREYQTLFASASAQVLASLDSRRIGVWAHNPYWHQGPQLQPQQREPVAARSQPQGLTPADSLIYAFESADEDRWRRSSDQPDRKSVV
jgi:hypothetical protein